MIMPSDKSYKLTKQVMLGNETMKAEFRPLANWIDKTYDVRTVNILYDTIHKEKIPQLEICFEFENEKRKFWNHDNAFYDKVKQKAIGEKFKQSMQEQGIENKGVLDFLKNPFAQKYKTDDVWVIYGAFEPIARIEANMKVTQTEIGQLKDELDNKDLWEISHYFDRATFFLYTDEQVKNYEHSELKKIWAGKYFDILDTHNEFGYFKRNEFNIYLDSKENFDNNYQSSWFYYYR